MRAVPAENRAVLVSFMVPLDPLWYDRNFPHFARVSFLNEKSSAHRGLPSDTGTVWKTINFTNGLRVSGCRGIASHKNFRQLKGEIIFPSGSGSVNFHIESDPKGAIQFSPDGKTGIAAALFEHCYHYRGASIFIKYCKRHQAFRSVTHN